MINDHIMMVKSSNVKNNQQPNHEFPTTKKGEVSLSNVMLSLATAPLLIGIVSFRGLLTTMIELGKTSEEVFRGDRLPLIEVPQPDSES